MNCTICGKRIQELPQAIKWEDKEGGACHHCVVSLRKTFGKYHEHFIPKKVCKK